MIKSEYLQKTKFSSIKTIYDRYKENHNKNQEESSEIVSFCQKDNEIKTMKRNIRRAMIMEDFEDPELIKAVTERFMDLGKVKFK